MVEPNPNFNENSDRQLVPTHYLRKGNDYASSTVYDESLCAMVVQWGDMGKSKVWMCAEIGITTATFDDWIRKHEKFAYAVELAKLKSQKHWEDLGQDNLFTKEFRESTWKTNMASRFGESWGDRQQVEHSLRPGSDPLSTFTFVTVPSGKFLSEEEASTNADERKDDEAVDQ